MTTRVVRTWEQMTLGGGFVRFHSETIGTEPHYWECEDENCSECYTYLSDHEKGATNDSGR
jgi:mannose/cellobiose epimerase-like protein (N-acyl-D-glucosamine 2-epimerase family)